MLHDAPANFSLMQNRTEDNCEAILTLISLNGGKDVLEVETRGSSTDEGATKESKE